MEDEDAEGGGADGSREDDCALRRKGRGGFGTQKKKIPEYEKSINGL